MEGGRGVLKEPVPPVVVEHAARPCSGVPLLAIPCLGGGADGVDVTTTQFLLKEAILRTKEEEEKARKKKEAQEKSDLELAKRDPWFAQHLAAVKAMEEQHLADMKAIEERRYMASSSSKRKRKKRRKRRTPRTSSRSSCGRSRRRQRQWRVRHAGFAGSCAPRDVFLWLVTGPCCSATRPVWTRWTVFSSWLWQWHMQCWFCWFRSSRCVSFCHGQALMLRIMDSIHQKDCYSVGWFYWCFCTSRCVSFLLSGP